MDALAQNPLTLVMNKAGAAVGTTTTYSITANPLAFIIKNRHYTKATVTNGATPTLDAVTGVAFVPIPTSFGSVFALGYDSGGNIKVSQGPLQALDVSNAFIALPQLPQTADSVAVFAYLLVKVGSTGSAWTFGVSNLAGPPAGVVFTFADVAGVLERPFAS